MAGAIAALVSSGVGALSAKLNRTSLTGFTFAVPATVQTSQSVTCVPTNGTPPYTYLWTYVSGGAGATPTNSTSATTFFQRYSASAGTQTCTWKCVVTDANTVVVNSDNVLITTTIGAGA